jgi:hypothetical protein
MVMARVFEGIQLPVKLAARPDGASLAVQEITLPGVEEQAFFGGYADDLLADLGADMLVDEPAPRVARKVQG